ncbi:uncharacterized protein [Triticum aestivum]|uniref:uncharacterized protein n=1 Tax=Triticum aestivum TaxID=4565 RepID=UPI001D02D8D7|nr:uncharacterized protein LOC123110191 [Triticum aestivum]
MVQSFRENGTMTYYTLDAGVRMFNEKEVDMMQGTGQPVWRCLTLANFAVQFLTTPGEYDMETAVSMFLPEKLAYSVKMCRLIMAPVLLEDSRAWCLYTFDRQRKVLIVLDPVHNLQDIDMLARLHAQNAELLLEGLKLVGQTLADGFTINRAEWDIEYNQGMHVPCSM